MTAAVDGELAARDRHALDGHLAGCDACRRELSSTERMLHMLAALPMDAAVSERLEQTTLRRVRVAAHEEPERGRLLWLGWRIPAVVLATAAVVVLAVGITLHLGEAPAPPVVVAPRGTPAGERVARAEQARPPRVARRKAARTVEPPAEPPAELAAAPDLFMNLPILKNMERLEHFEAIRMTTLEDPTPNGQGEPSNG
jgi:anti-sigma factor RsiW